MNNCRNARLVLRSSDLYILGPNGFEINTLGAMNQERTNFTWNNINLQTVLGDLYDDYDLFNLNLVQVMSNSTFGGNYGTNTMDRNVIFRISGLPFINETYNFVNRCNTNQAVLCGFVFPNTGSIGLLHTYDSQNNLTFSKNQNLCNINIFHSRMDGNPTSTVVIAPDMLFIFNIYGVKKDYDVNMNKRLF
jgi:hypothetical protein